MKHFNFKDITGQKFNRLTALECTNKKKQGNYIWKFECECGASILVKAGDVISNNTKSCGCQNTESIINRNIVYKRKPNNESNKNSLYNHYKAHAKHRGISFELTKEEFVEMAESNCYYCGLSPVRFFRGNKWSGEWKAEGVDRLDSSIGYTPENTVPCCKQCNTMKMAYSEESFYRKVKQIYENKGLADKLSNIQIRNEVRQ